MSISQVENSIDWIRTAVQLSGNDFTSSELHAVVEVKSHIGVGNFVRADGTLYNFNGQPTRRKRMNFKS